MADLYQPRNQDELVQRFLRDVRLAAVAEDLPEPPTQVGTDFWLTANGIAGICLLGFGNIALAEDDQNVLTATGEALDVIRQGLGLPEVSASPARGKIVVTVLGATTIPNGQAFLYPNGTSGRVVGAYVNPTDQAEISVEAAVVGTKGNLKAGQTVRFVGPPVNVAVDAKVSLGSPLTGGTDLEDDKRKRDRILNTLRNKPAGGNWAHIRQIVLDANGGVQDCYVYPALGGPASVKVVPVKDFDLENTDFSRSVSAAALSVVRAAVQANIPVGVETVVEAAVGQSVDIALGVTIPDSAQSGGNGQGWTDTAPWPPLVVGDAGRVTISAPLANLDGFTASAGTSTEPVDGQTHIAWWSRVDRKFYTALVVSHVGGVAGSWPLVLDRPLVDSSGAGPQAGDFVCPAAQNLEGYGVEWISTFRGLGPGENTADTNRLPRAKRHPDVADEDPHTITNSVLKRLVSKYPEITAIQLGYTSATAPTIPALTATAPNILVPRHFGVYAI